MDHGTFLEFLITSAKCRSQAICEKLRVARIPSTTSRGTNCEAAQEGLHAQHSMAFHEILDNPEIEEQLTSALGVAANFNEQTAERVNIMKSLVLQAFDGDNDRSAFKRGHANYSKDITTKIVSLVEGRSEAVDRFRKAHEEAEIMLTNLKRGLVASDSAVQADAVMPLA